MHSSFFGYHLNLQLLAFHRQFQYRSTYGTSRLIQTRWGSGKSIFNAKFAQEHEKLRSEGSLSLRHLTVQIPCPPSADDIHLAQVCILLSSVGTVVHGFSFQALAKIQVELTSQGELSIPAISDRLDRCQVQTQQKLEGRRTGHAAASNMGVSVCESTSNFDSFGRHMDSCCIIWYKFKAEGNHPHVSEDTYEASQANIRSGDVSIAMSYAFLKYEKAFCSRSWNGACRTTMRQLRKCEGEETVFYHFPRDFLRRPRHHDEMRCKYWMHCRDFSDDYRDTWAELLQNSFHWTESVSMCLLMDWDARSEKQHWRMWVCQCAQGCLGNTRRIS